MSGASERVVIAEPEAGPTPPTPPAAGTPGERPSWLPEKFKSPEDMAKAYDSAQAELTRMQQAATAEAPALPSDGPAVEAPAEPATPATPPAGDKALATDLEAKGVDVSALSQQFWADGKISEENYQKLEAIGISRADADTYADIKRTNAEANTSKLMEQAGGEDRWQQMTAWAKENYGPENIAAFNAANASGNPASQSQALTALNAAFEAATGKAPERTLAGGGGLNGGADGYQSNVQMRADMKDPRYEKDPAFRAAVQAKLARSSI